MTNTGIFISRTTLDALSPDLRSTLLAELFPSTSATTNRHAGTLVNMPDTRQTKDFDDGEDSNFLELSPAQARVFFNGCSQKTRTAIRAMVSGPSPRFQVADVAKALSLTPSDLTGVWSGLTRRSRTVSGEDKSYLIRWSQQPKYDSRGNYIDEIAWFADMTYNSFRKVIGA